MTMKAEDVTETRRLALDESGLDMAKIGHRPRLLSDNGPSYVANDLADWLGEEKVGHSRGAPNQGKIERVCHLSNI
jgi:hypothetical protein